MIKDAWTALANAPLRVKIVAGLCLLYLANPIDLIPDFIPVIGQLDDVFVLAFLVRYLTKNVPSVNWERFKNEQAR